MNKHASLSDVLSCVHDVARTVLEQRRRLADATKVSHDDCAIEWILYQYWYGVQRETTVLTEEQKQKARLYELWQRREALAATIVPPATDTVRIVTGSTEVEDIDAALLRLAEKIAALRSTVEREETEYNRLFGQYGNPAEFDVGTMLIILLLPTLYLCDRIDDRKAQAAFDKKKMFDATGEQCSVTQRMFFVECVACILWTAASLCVRFNCKLIMHVSATS
jgi:hypothetical protein